MSPASAQVGPPRGQRRAAGLAALLCCVLLLPSRAQAELKLEVQLEPEATGVGEQSILTVSVEGAIQLDQGPVVPPVDGLVVQGAGQSTNISIVNGRMSRSATYQFLLLGQRPGQYTIGPVEVRDGGRLYRSATVTLTVGAGGAAPGGPAGGAAPAPSNRGQPGGGEAREPEESGNLFVRAEVDRDRVFVGEQVTLRFQFFQRAGYPLLQSPQYEAPGTEGFWREDLPPQRTSNRTVRGEMYQVTELVYALFPTRSGRLDIGPGTLECVVRDRGRSRDPFSFFGGLFTERTVRLSSRPLVVRADPLPEPRPADFTGGVGSYRLRASLERAEVGQNEPVTLSLRIEGTGNLSTVGEPPMPELVGFRSYPSGSEAKPDKRGDVLAGSRTFSVVLVPESTGRKEIPPVHLSVFDPQQRRYVRLESEPLALMVVPARPGASGDEGGEVTQVGRDLRTIRTATRLLPVGSSNLAGRTRYWMVQILPLFLLGMAWAWRARRERMEANWGAVLSRGASGRLRRELEAMRAQPGLDPVEGYSRLDRALERYLTDRFRLPVRGSTREELQAALSGQGIGEEVMGRVRAILDRCDFARFAPQAQSREEFAQSLAEAQALPEVLEPRRRPRSRAASLPLLAIIAGCTLLIPGYAPAAHPMSAEAAASAFREGNEAYGRGDYPAAARAFGRVLAGGYESPDLLLNLGNASYRAGRLGWAVYYFERGLRLAPADPDLRANLDLALQQTKDRVPEVDASRFLRRLVDLQGRTSEAGALRGFSLFWWLFLLWLAARVAVGGSAGSSGQFPGLVAGRPGSLAGLLLGALLLGSAGWAGMKMLQAGSGPDAVVISDELPVRSNPDPEATIEFTLHAGTRVRLGRGTGSFREVLFSDKLRGWGSMEGLASLGARGSGAVAAGDVESWPATPP